MMTSNRESETWVMVILALLVFTIFVASSWDYKLDERLDRLEELHNLTEEVQ